MLTKEQFESAEYANFRNEQNNRIDFMYIHGIQTVSAVAAVFSINIGLFVGFYNLIESLIQSDALYYTAVALDEAGMAQRDCRFCVCHCRTVLSDIRRKRCADLMSYIFVCKEGKTKTAVIAINRIDCGFCMDKEIDRTE